MAPKLRKYRLYLAACCFAVAVSLAWWWAGGLNKVKADDSSESAKAQELVAAYAKHVGAHDTVHQTLDASGDRSFGDFGFKYFPQRDVLQARVYIVLSHEKDWPDRAKYSKQVDIALNDPKIGGMYDRGGGHFFLDEDKQITFLVKDYKVANTTPVEFVRDVDNLNAVGGMWVTSWLGHLARQTFGAEPLPIQRVTRENDPYKR